MRHKGYSFINIFGLVIGMTSCILISFWVKQELSYDLYHTNVDRIYRLGVDGYLGRSFRLPLSSVPAGPTILENYPEIENYTRISKVEEVAIKHDEEEIFDVRMASVDSTFFKIFSFQLKIGDPGSVLKNPNSLVISEKLSNQIFSDSNPIGKIVTINGNQDYEITGVLNEIPASSHLNFDVLGSIQTLYTDNKIADDRWLPFSFYTYLLLSPETDPGKVEEKIVSILEGTRLESILKETGGSLTFFLQPLREIHLYSHLEGEFSPNGNIVNVYLFSIIAVVILMMACFNYINLSTALWSIRGKEIGLRQTLGASRLNVILQILIESILQCFTALLLSVILLKIIESEINTFTNIQLDFSIYEQLRMIPLIILFSILLGILGGLFPAIFISSYNPIKILKGNLSFGNSHTNVRNVLVMVQFVFSISLIIGTIVIYSQMSYARNKDLGFNKDFVVYISNLSDETIRKKASIKENLLTISGVESVSFSSSIPGIRYMKGLFHPEGFTEEESQSMDMISVDDDYSTTLGISLVQGRYFDKMISSDSSESVIINETAARKFGWKDPIGKYFSFNTDQPGVKSKMYVIGVVGDFHVTSIRENIDPLFIENNPQSFNTISIKLVPQNLSNTINDLSNSWKEVLPSQPFNYKFLDETYFDLYKSEENLSKVIYYFSLLAILLGCLGLFGISMFLLGKRSKEIAIRKVHGATLVQILALLSKKYTMSVLIAFVIASSISWYLMNKWLENFAYRIILEWWYFALAGILALLIAWLTISYQSYIAAVKNPVKTLRYE